MDSEIKKELLVSLATSRRLLEYVAIERCSHALPKYFSFNGFPWDRQPKSAVGDVAKVKIAIKEIPSRDKISGHQMLSSPPPQNR